MKISLAYPGVTYVGEVVSHQISWDGQPIDLDQVLEISKSPQHGVVIMKDGTSLELFSRGFLNREKMLLTGTIVIRSVSLKREVHCDVRLATYIAFDARQLSADETPSASVRKMRHGALPV